MNSGGRRPVGAGGRFGMPSAWLGGLTAVVAVVAMFAPLAAAADNGLLAAGGAGVDVGVGVGETSEVFAVIVTNNRSTRLDRPDLQYADDDGARYYQLLTGVASPDNVHLLTRFDRATAATHPVERERVTPPRRSELLAALEATRSAVVRTHQAGKRAEFYFIFAGHGDVEAGTGYLDLEDSRLDSTFLEAEVVNRVGADVQHIILDSCNSFFVVNPRKPGGRRFATPRDLALGFASRHPNVGVFLSTNSEAEVYEWSELESGIFSHEVRSGLSGAADANGDGRVSYAELAGFVDRANLKLPRASLRPQVFERGPGGDADAPLFSPARARGRRVVLGTAQRRIWIRGAAAERLIDLHKEAGDAMTIVVPGPATQPLSIIESRAAVQASARPTIAEYEVPAGASEPISFAALAAGAPTSAPRGGNAMFGDLFSVPYGAHAFAGFLAEQRGGDEPIFGISSADEARMRHYLTFIAESDREISRNQAVTVGGMGAVVVGTAAATFFSRPRWDGSPGGALTVGGLGVALLGVGLHLGLSKPPGQKALESFEAELRSTGDNRAAAVAHVESELDELGRGERRMARIMVGIFGATSLVLAAATTANLTDGAYGGHTAENLIAGFGVAAVMGAAAIYVAHSEMPTERLLRLYRSDPELKLSFGVSPTTSGGLGFAVAGRF